MATINEVIDSIADPEMQQWLISFFGTRFGTEVFDRDPEQWHSELGLNIQKVCKYFDGRIYQYISLDNSLVSSLENPVVVYIDSFGGYASPRRELVALYGIFSKLGHTPFWYEIK